MRMLFIGGTRFVGRAMAAAALEAGHDVTVLHRGNTPGQDLDGAEHLLADRNEDLSALADRTFDATVDVCAYLPRQVESLAAALGERGGHHIFVSTMSVYADEQVMGFDEDAELAHTPDPDVDTVTAETYGGLKVLCERAAVAAYGADRVAIIRPTYVVGPNDYTFRFPYWVDRIANGGRVLAPGPRRSPVQLVDARDQGAWAVNLAENGISGAFNGVGTSIPFGFEDMLSAIETAVAPDGTELAWVDGAWLVEQGVSGSDLPLWSEGGDEGVLAGSNARALATGLRPRPLQQTIVDTLEWIRTTDAQPPQGQGLAKDREIELLEQWSAANRDQSTTH